MIGWLDSPQGVRYVRCVALAAGVWAIAAHWLAYVQVGVGAGTLDLFGRARPWHPLVLRGWAQGARATAHTLYTGGAAHADLWALPAAAAALAAVVALGYVTAARRRVRHAENVVRGAAVVAVTAAAPGVATEVFGLGTIVAAIAAAVVVVVVEVVLIAVLVAGVLLILYAVKEQDLALSVLSLVPGAFGTAVSLYQIALHFLR